MRTKPGSKAENAALTRVSGEGLLPPVHESSSLSSGTSETSIEGLAARQAKLSELLQMGVAHARRMGVDFGEWDELFPERDDLIPENEQ